MSELNDQATSPNWFLTNIEYEGRGQAEFSKPEGIAEGSVKIRFDEHGYSTIEMEVDKIEPRRPLKMGVLQLLSGASVSYFGTGFIMGIGGTFNHCKKLIVTTKDGVFTADEKNNYQSD